jgi:hypothetical protein
MLCFEMMWNETCKVWFRHDKSDLNIDLRMVTLCQANNPKIPFFLMKAEIHWVATGIFYLLFNMGLVLFVVAPAYEKNAWIHALLFGAIF